MTDVFITIDTEYSAGIYDRLGFSCRAENFDKSILGRTPNGDVGISYQMDVFDRYGMKAVFFVDPMPALIWGVEAIADIVSPIIARGHDVQLHLHSEWLAFAGDANPLGSRTGQNMKDFSRDEQKRLLDFAARTLVEAGAPYPVAFRAGNYGANDDTLRALADLGLAYDTSHCPGIAAAECAIGLSKTQYRPVAHCGVMELPIGAIGAIGNKTRHAQITALSAAELISAIRFAHQQNLLYFTVVSHSFELMSRDRKRINKIIKKRFETFCRLFAAMPDVTTMTFNDDSLSIASSTIPSPVLPHNIMRTGARLAEQLLSNKLYGGK
ncbi:polysaccharide deacetylase family protein [Parasphingorhabdus flavimaris]|uniref:Polysaccharide deacetylase family protein n=1 Tax=Parasphingorhabdus flavimaris TaxID=266812 RepID=A0ABX2N2F0_9SPHN|nr:polysaccharide deacetylase family protein [Parasphingorhabdus flavimaris]NVD27862.1 polysaccharide deacetylase family protein [Parasphingorhabdus flavimaris]|tara:strand:+ start:16884 stop:17858 length:975 start_codon:yes stop_codon:yes gene_type:complete